MRPTCILAALLLLVPAPGRAAGLWELDTTTYRNEELGIRLNVPYGWLLNRSSGYPSILVQLFPPQAGASITLSRLVPARGRSLAQQVAGECQAMARVGIRVRQCGTRLDQQTPRLEVSAFAADRRGALTQIYLPHTGNVLVLTLFSDTATQAEGRATLLRVLDLLELAQVSKSKAQENVIRAVRHPPRPGARGGDPRSRASGAPTAGEGAAATQPGPEGQAPEEPEGPELEQDPADAELSDGEEELEAEPPAPAPGKPRPPAPGQRPPGGPAPQPDAPAVP